MEIERSELRFLHDFKVSLWDCSGSDEAMQSYVEEQAEAMFTEVLCLIYVFDVHNRISEVDMLHYEAILEALRTWSPDATVYTLLHKTDMLAVDQQSAVLKDKRAEVEKRAIPSLIHTFGTSIWDESLYKAWSSIVHALLPDVKRIELQLAAYAEDLKADEVVLFEPNTLLVLAQAIRHHHHDHHRFEKVSSIVKQFRMACLGKGRSPKSFIVRTGGLGETGKANRMVIILDRISENAVVLVTGKQGHFLEKKMATEKLMSLIDGKTLKS